MANGVEEWVVGPENTKYFTRRYNAPSNPPKAVIVWVHGYQEHITRYDHVFKFWAGHGFTVVGWDQRGWGRTAEDVAERSKGSVYGWTSRPQQIAEVDFFLKREIASIPATTPIFLAGHSMGGALVLSFATQPSTAPTASTIPRLAGIISSAPFIQKTVMPPKFLIKVASAAAKIFPKMNYPAEIPTDDLISDPETSRKAANDPMMKNFASLKALADIFAAADSLAQKEYDDFPVNLPLIVVFGDSDKVCSIDAARTFFDKVSAKDKTFIPYEGSYHEIHNEPKIWEREQQDLLSWTEKHMGDTTAKL